MEKAKTYPAEGIQENPKLIAEELRRDFSKVPSLHKSITNFIPILEEYALRDKSRAGQYREIAQSLRKVASDIKSMITDYEGA
jgi:hypothetical protein